MEGERWWTFTAPAFAHATPASAAPTAAAVYLPAGWKKRRKKSKKQSAKRHKGPAAAAAAPAPAAAVAAPAAAALWAAQPTSLLPNPAQLAPLRCSWPHPAVLNLLAQQCWPAAGPAALAQRCAAAWAPAAWQLSSTQPAWWNGMLPSLSLLHPPLPAPQQLELLAACSNGGCGGSGSVGGAGSTLQAVPLPQPKVLVGYEEDWLEVAAEVLPLWQAAQLTPFAGPKTLLHYLLCPEQQLAGALQLVKDVGSVYETCNLGTLVPSSSEAVRTFQPIAGGAAGLGDDGLAGVEQQQQQQLPGSALAGYLSGLRAACEQLQRQLLLDPPPELQQLQGSSLEDGAEPAVLVYIACPLDAPADHVTALLEAASLLAPCTPLGAASEAAGASVCLLPHVGSDLELGASMNHQLAPCEPQQPDRPATTTPATDTSRAPGGSPPPDEQAEPALAPAATEQQQPQQQQQQQRYHGAAQILHDQQQGDFRQLPVRRLQRPDSSRPINIVLQVLTPQALADISGTAARCIAFAVYSKMRHVPSSSSSSSQLEPADVVPAELLDAPPPSLPFCSQPLMVLASAASATTDAGAEEAVLQAQQQQQQQPPLPPGPAPPLPPLPPGPGEEQHEDGECTEEPQLPLQLQEEQQQLQPDGLGGQAQPRQPQPAVCGPEPAPQHRTLHCFYALPPAGCSLVPLAFTDSCGELLHAEFLDITVDRVMGLSMAGIAGSSTDSLAATATGAGAIHGSGCSTAGKTCRLVLQRCLELLGALRSASSPPSVLHSIAIAGSGMQPAEREAWRQLVQHDPALPLKLPAGAELAVLEIQALPPARFTGPDPPSGCQLLLQQGVDGTGELQASVTWLPPADGTSSLLPREHDVVRTLRAALVCRCSSEELAAREQEQPGRRSDEDSLCCLATELHCLAWLQAAFQGACLRTVAGGGLQAGPDAHLPLHAALGAQLHALLLAATTAPLPLC